jgi:hypothetical protein
LTGASELRASDQQRDHAAKALREHFAAGRITQDELSDRVQTVYSARTEQELQALLADLPRLPATREQQKAELAERRRELRRRLLQETGRGVGLFVVCTVIWAAAGAHHGCFWPIWVLIFPLLVLLRNGWRLYGPALGPAATAGSEPRGRRPGPAAAAGEPLSPA